MKKLTTGLLVSLLSLFFVARVQAQSVDCNSPTSVAPDGRTLSGSIPAVTTFWFSVAARGTSSYAAEANYPTAADSAFPGLNAFAPGDVQPGCSGSSSLSPRNIMQFDPVIPNGNRVSVTAASAMTILVSVTNSTMQARDFTMRVAETTLFNPLWSTFGGFETFYRLQNTTRDSLTVTLRLINDAGTTVATHNQPLAANSTAPTIFTGPGPAPGLGVPDNQAGQAILTHDGPPGALQVDGFLGLFTATPVVLPIKIVPAREGVSISRLQPSGGGGGGGAVNSVTAGDASITIGGTATDPTVAVTDGGITTAKLADANVTPAKLSFTAGTVSSLTEGTGIDLTPDNITGTGSIGVNLAGPGAATSVARSDHTHAKTPGTGNTAVGEFALATNSGDSNTAMGANALDANTTGASNSAVGLNALGANTTGETNSAFGALALLNNTLGSQNSAFGASALAQNTEGNSNSAFGAGALQSSTGFSNSAFGAGALQSSTGFNNSAFGFAALVNSTTGVNNTATGAGALSANTTASNNTAVGLNALVANNAAGNTAVGAFALDANSTGTDNTAVGLNALGANTTASNNTAVGSNALLANGVGASNTAVGAFALDANINGVNNTALGHNALGSNSSGGGNTAVGTNALGGNNASGNTGVGTSALGNNTSGASNTAVGASALFVNNAGADNTAVGANALDANTTGTSNTAVGRHALGGNTTADNNSAFGASALASNVAGGSNTAVGTNALLNNTAANNTALGSAALQGNVTGINNVAVGDTALASITGSSIFNIALGSNAGTSLTFGSSNIYIGNNGEAVESNKIRIGTVGQQFATFVAGIRGVGVAGGNTVVVDANGQLGDATASSRRLKEDIHDMGEASARLLQLRPVVFRYRQPAADGSKPIEFGLIAEEVAEQMPELVVYDAEGQPSGVRYHVLPALLLNELQRQQAKVDRQAEDLAALRELLAAQGAELAEVKAALRSTLVKR